MDTTTLILIWILIIGVIVGLVVWFGPRPAQWRAHHGSEETPEETGEQERTSREDQPDDR